VYAIYRLKKLSDSQFKRYTGISRSTFSLTVEQIPDANSF